MSQHKSFSVPVLNIKTADRIVTGVASVFGNIDSGLDVVAPGAFAKAVAAFKNGRSRAVFLWNHDDRQPPVAKILDLKAVGRDQLPASVLAKEPNAQGGLVVKRQYFKDGLADRVYQGITSGAITEMSFAYAIKSSRYEERDGKNVRILEDLELLDLSDVNWGMNAATVAAGAKGRRYSYGSGGRSALTATQRVQIRSLETFMLANDPAYAAAKLLDMKLAAARVMAEPILSGRRSSRSGRRIKI